MIHYYFQRFRNFSSEIYLLKEIHLTTFGVAMHRAGIHSDQDFKECSFPNLYPQRSFSLEEHLSISEGYRDLESLVWTAICVSKIFIGIKL